MFSIEAWYNKFMLFSFLTGALVSILGTVFIHCLNDYYQLFVLTSLLGLTVGATTALYSDFRIAIVYISIIMFPLIVSTATSHESLAFILPILLTLFYFTQVLMIYNRYTQEKEINELKGQQNLLNDLFSEVPLGMFTYDKDLTVLYVNNHLNKIFEYTDEMIGADLHTIPDTNFINILQNTLTQGPQSYTGPYRSIKGNTFWFETVWFPFKDIHDNVLGGVAIIDDKTKEHMDQKELESLHITLHDQIMKNEFLLKENKRFIADMVHQIRTPLSVIMTNTSLIEMKAKDQVSSYTRQINSAINMLSNSYEDLSYIITNDTIEYKPKNIDFSNLLQERIDFFEVIAEANTKTISTDIANDIHCYMNDIELERLIDNNLSNAIKHSYDKSEIRVILEKSPSEIILHFISEGKNIHDVTRLFDKNYTESAGAKRSLGLGLNMVKSICEKNDIKYSVDSKDHRNTFTYIFRDICHGTKP
jgi:PAS domain S-box-containing protein